MTLPLRRLWRHQMATRAGQGKGVVDVSWAIGKCFFCLFFYWQFIWYTALRQHRMTGAAGELLFLFYLFLHWLYIHYRLYRYDEGRARKRPKMMAAPGDDEGRQGECQRDVVVVVVSLAVSEYFIVLFFLLLKNWQSFLYTIDILRHHTTAAAGHKVKTRKRSKS